MTVPAKDPVTLIRYSSNYAESEKTALQGGFFVSGQEITLDLLDPSTNLYPNTNFIPQYMILHQPIG